MKYSTENIEDWDFRQFTLISPDGGISAASATSEEGMFLAENYVLVVQVQTLRVLAISSMMLPSPNVSIGDEAATLLVVDPDDSAYAILNPQYGLGEDVLKQVCRPRLSGRLTAEGRLRNRVLKSIWREWQKYGKVKRMLLPTEVQKAAMEAAWIESEHARHREDQEAVLGKLAETPGRDAAHLSDVLFGSGHELFTLDRQPDPETGRVLFGVGDGDAPTAWWVAVYDDEGRCSAPLTLKSRGEASEMAATAGISFGLPSGFQQPEQDPN